MAACTRTLFFFAFFVSAVSIGMVDGARPKMMTVAGLFPMSGGWSGGIHVLPAANLTINLVNAMDDILPHTTLKMVAADTQCNANRGLMSLLDLFAVQDGTSRRSHTHARVPNSATSSSIPTSFVQA
mmetsp:Transcript_48925/g.138161  ORF Transcript_48925/g.138161 Transcript_48925/m.138161 type:complete len:127 (+) Transcript_48925:124-504(+)